MKTTDEILANEKLIFAFMYNNGMRRFNKFPRYLIDWNQIMKVIARIEGLGYVVEIRGFDCVVWGVDFSETNDTKILSRKPFNIDEDKIYFVWLMLVDFINQYNKQG